jgi:hypothetical protein
MEVLWRRRESHLPDDRCLSRRAHVHEVTSDWKYVPSLNFYRILYATNDLDEFHEFDKIPPAGKAIYVLPTNEFKEFIRTEGLQVVYHGAVFDLVIAVRPGATSSP